MTQMKLRQRPTLSLRRMLLAAAIAFAVINLASGLLKGNAAAAPRPATDAEIEAYLIEQVRDAGYPGAAFAIVRYGRVSHSGGIGRADGSGRDVTSRTPFMLGSLSKAITAAAILQLAERGEIDLDAPVTSYVPDFAVAGSDGDAITVRHLLHQTSGLPTLAGTAPLAGPVTDLEAQVAALRSASLASEPGSTFQYSNANYVVLGLAVERVTGRSFGEYVSREIFDRIGMDDSWVDLDAATADGLTDAHRFWFGIPSGGQPLWRPDLLPAGWLIASADDMGRFLAANMATDGVGDTRLLSAESLDVMHRGAVQAGRAAYAMGLFDGHIGETRVVSHSGSTTDMGGAMYLAPDDGVGIVLLYNGQSVVYELLHKGEAIAEAAMARLLGEPSGGTLQVLYPAFTVAVVLMIALQLRSLVRAVRRARRREPAVKPVFGSRTAGVAAAAWGWAIAPALVLTGTPDMLGAQWPILVQIDLGQVLATYAVLQLLIGVVSTAPEVLRLAGQVRGGASGTSEPGWRRLAP